MTAGGSLAGNRFNQPGWKMTFLGQTANFFRREVLSYVRFREGNGQDVVEIPLFTRFYTSANG